MNKQILTIAIALPMVIASAASSLANQAVTSRGSNQLKNRVNIDNLQLINTQQELLPSTDIMERPKPKGPKGFELGEQQTPNQQAVGNPANLVERPKPPGPGGHDPGLKQTNQQLLNLSSETRVRPKPKGPGGHDLGLQQTNQQLLNLPSETRVRPKPKGPGGHDPNLQVVPQQQLQY